MQQRPPINYLLCTYQFLPNSTQFQIIMSISQHHIGQPYYGNESIKQEMQLQTLYSLVFSFWLLPQFLHSKDFQPPHWIKSHSNSQVVQTNAQVYHFGFNSLLENFEQVLTFVNWIIFPKHMTRLNITNQSIGTPVMHSILFQPQQPPDTLP